MEVGQIIGGALAVGLLTLLIEWAVVKRVMDNPVAGAVASTVAAYLVAVIVSGFGLADGGGWESAGIVIYAPGAILVGILMWRRAKSHPASEL